MKQKLKIFLKSIIIFIFLTVVGIIGLNKLTNKDYNSLNHMDKSMLEQLSQIYETYSSSSQDIWKKDYTFHSIPLVLTPVSKDRGMTHAYSYVVGVDKLKNSIFSKEIQIPKEMNLPPVYRVSFLSPHLIKSWLPGNFIFTDIGKQHVTFFKYNPVTTQEANKENSFKYFLIHEVFHEYRQAPLWKNIDQLHSSIYVEERHKEQYELLLTEFSILDKAYITNSNEDLITILKDFITVREARYNKFQYMKQEKAVETLEGCAQYIEYKYSKEVGDSVKPPFTVNGENYRFSDVFNKKALEDFTSKRSLNGFMDKDLYYYVGSLEGILLDRLGINWKERVENNELIYDILRDEILKQEKGNMRSLEDIKTEYGYNNFNEEAQIIVDNLK